MASKKAGLLLSKAVKKVANKAVKKTVTQKRTQTKKVASNTARLAVEKAQAEARKRTQIAKAKQAQENALANTKAVANKIQKKAAQKASANISKKTTATIQQVASQAKKRAELTNASRATKMAGGVASKVKKSSVEKKKNIRASSNRLAPSYSADQSKNQYREAQYKAGKRTKENIKKTLREAGRENAFASQGKEATYTYDNGNQAKKRNEERAKIIANKAKKTEKKISEGLDDFGLTYSNEDRERTARQQRYSGYRDFGNMSREDLEKASMDIAKDPYSLGLLEGGSLMPVKTEALAEWAYRRGWRDKPTEEWKNALAETRETGAYKGTYMMGVGAQYMVPGAAMPKVGSMIMRGAVKNAPKLGKVGGKLLNKVGSSEWLSRRVADNVLNTPLNFTQALKDANYVDENGNIRYDGKTFGLSFLLNQGADLVLGGGIDGIGVLSRFRKNKPIRSALSTPEYRSLTSIMAKERNNIPLNAVEKRAKKVLNDKAKRHQALNNIKAKDTISYTKKAVDIEYTNAGKDLKYDVVDDNVLNRLGIRHEDGKYFNVETGRAVTKTEVGKGISKLKETDIKVLDYVEKHPEYKEFAEYDKFKAKRAELAEKIAKQEEKNPADLDKYIELDNEVKAVEARHADNEYGVEGARFDKVAELEKEYHTSVENQGDVEYNNGVRRRENGEASENIGRAEGDLQPRGTEGAGRVDGSIQRQMVYGDGTERILQDSNRLSASNANGRIVDLSNKPEDFISSLKSNAETQKFGVAVDTNYTAADLKEAKLISIDNGNITIGIKSDGDIFALAKNANSNASLDDAIYAAIKNGGNKMDAYGIVLARKYQEFGFEPVARVKYNPDFVSVENRAVFDEMKKAYGDNDIYVFAHNGDSLEDVVRKHNNREYKLSTQEELNKLPEMEYDEALKYRDDLMAGRVERKSADNADSLVVNERTKAKQSKVIITQNMSDKERVEALSKATIEPAIPNPQRVASSLKEIENLKQETVYQKAEEALKNIGQKFGIINKKYYNKNIEVEFAYSNRGIHESISKQASASGDYGQLAKAMLCFDEIVERAVPVETHVDKYVGTLKANHNLDRTYVLISAMRDNESLLPIELVVKVNKAEQNNNLYVTVVLEENKKKAINATHMVANSDGYATMPSEISVPELIGKINPNDGSFLKYLPDELLTKEQLKGKAIGIEKDANKLTRLRKETIKEIKKLKDEIKSLEQQRKPTKNKIAKLTRLEKEVDSHRADYEADGLLKPKVNTPLAQQLKVKKAKKVKKATKAEQPKAEEPKAKSKAEKLKEDNPTNEKKAEGSKNNYRTEALNEQEKRIIEQHGIDEELARKEFVESTRGGHIWARGDYKISADEALATARKSAKDDYDHLYKKVMEFEEGRADSMTTAAERVAVFDEALERYKKAKTPEEKELYLEQFRRISEKDAYIKSQQGYGLQAQKAMYQLSSSGRVRVMQRQVKQLEKRYADRLKGKTLELDPDILAKIQDAKTNDEIFEALDEANRKVWDQIPATKFEKFNELRHFSMLFNPKTHARNVIGNTAFKGIRYLSDGMEILAYKNPAIRKKLTSMGGDVTMVKVTKQELKDSKDYLHGVFESNYKQSGSRSRYIETTRPDGSPTFKSKAVQKWVDRNYGLLEWEDVKLMLESEYRKNYLRWCKSKDISIEKMAEMTDAQKRAADKFAMNKAEYATFRDDSALSRHLTGLKTAAAGKQGKTFVGTAGYRAGNMALEGALPFVKTPVNILRRSVDYSPIGLVRGVTKLLRTNDAEIFKAGVHDICTGLSGTGVTALGAWMASHDWVTTHAGDVSGDAYYDRDMGFQDFALNINWPNGKKQSWTIDWFSPMQVPLFMGAILHDDWVNGKGLSVETLFDALAGVGGSMMDMSFMTGTKDTIETFMEKVYRNGTGDNADWSGAIMQTLGGSLPQNYLNGFIPQAARQMANVLDPYQRDTRSTKEGVLDASWDSWKNKLINNVPVLRNFVLNPKVNSRGELVKTTGDNTLTRFLYQVMNPSTVKNIRLDEYDRKIIDLYNELPEGNTQKKYFWYNFTGNPSYDLGNGKRMSYDELFKYGQESRKEQFNMVKNMLDSSRYEFLTSDMKASEIKSAYNIGNTTADYKTYGAKFAIDNILKYRESEGSHYNLYSRLGGSDEQFVKTYLTKEKIISQAHDTSYYTKALAIAVAKDPIASRAYGVYGEKVVNATNYLNKGGSVEEYTNAMSKIMATISKNGATDSMANKAMAATKHNINVRTYEAMGLLDKADVGAGLDKFGYSYQALDSMKADALSGFDKDGNGRFKKAEIISYIDSLGITSNEEKACIFAYFSNAKNPYGSIPNYSGMASAKVEGSGGSGRSYSGRRYSRRSSGGSRRKTSTSSSAKSMPSWETFAKQAMANTTKANKAKSKVKYTSSLNKAYMNRIKKILENTSARS